MIRWHAGTEQLEFINDENIVIQLGHQPSAVEELVRFLETRTNEYLEGFYAEDNAKNPYDFWAERIAHYDFSNGNQSERRKVYAKFNF